MTYHIEEAEVPRVNTLVVGGVPNKDRIGDFLGSPLERVADCRE